MTGKKYGKLTVVRRAPDKIQANGRHRVMWECICECGKQTIVYGDNLKKGTTQSCGCYADDIRKIAKKKYNDYDISGEYGIGWTTNTGHEFYFDLEDFDKIKNYCWREMKTHYIATHDKKYCLYLHRLVTNAGNNNFIVDHINHNIYDNRKKNLRICTQSNNMMNGTKKISNTSGVTGDWWSNHSNKWIAEITVNQKKIYLGSFNDIEEAASARKQAEDIYFGNYSYSNSMKQLVT